MLKYCLSPMRQGSFLKDIKGVAAVEFAILFPALLFLFMGSSVLVEGFRAKRLHQKAASTIVDLLSRDSKMDQSAVNELFLVGNALVGTAANNSNFSIVFGSVMNNNNSFGQPTLSYWSCVSDRGAHFTQERINQLELPNIPSGESIMIAQVIGSYMPLFDLDFISNIEFIETANRPPRFLRQINPPELRGSCELHI